MVSEPAQPTSPAPGTSTATGAFAPGASPATGTAARTSVSSTGVASSAAPSSAAPSSTAPSTAAASIIAGASAATPRARRPVISGRLLRPMPATIARPPAICPGPTGSPNATAPAMAPTSGSRFRKAPATSADTRLCPKANRVNGTSVPAVASATTASTAPRPPWPAGVTGAPSVTMAKASAPIVAPRNCTAVTATGSRPVSSRPWATVTAADRSREISTRPSPGRVAPPPPPPTVTRPTPASDTMNPAQATGGATARCQTAAMTATMTGTAPMSSAAWVTLVRVMPAFCTTTEPP